MIIAIKIVIAFLVSYLTCCVICEIMLYAKKEHRFRGLIPKKHLRWKDDK